MTKTILFFYKIVEHPLFDKIFIPLLLLIIGLFVKSLYDKQIWIKPKLYLKMGKPVYIQRFLGYDVGYDLTWCFECILKNNSKYDAYNIQIFEMKMENENDYIVTNRIKLKNYFEKFNHLSINSYKEFELHKTIHVDTDVLINFRIEDGQQIILPGIKINNPQDALMPIILNNIKLIVLYENEKGKKFYIIFTRINGKESNKIITFNPFIFKRYVQITT